MLGGPLTSTDQCFGKKWVKSLRSPFSVATLRLWVFPVNG
jgi:hypothetical protein